ncbi:hypothetical protein A0H81_00940 [Grifola frondosa]|uniref:Uncharacterized protein n=1 Tax=Grifola frondosa TaxID=5627 RepID=A0A1C7MQZ3_GRIFR|nr:hypothetical protein A0H81_00940 [Grifola frondosa]
MGQGSKLAPSAGADNNGVSLAKDQKRSPSQPLQCRKVQISLAARGTSKQLLTRAESPVPLWRYSLFFLALSLPPIASVLFPTITVIPSSFLVSAIS